MILGHSMAYVNFFGNAQTSFRDSKKAKTAFPTRTRQKTSLHFAYSRRSLSRPYKTTTLFLTRTLSPNSQESDKGAGSEKISGVGELRSLRQRFFHKKPHTVSTNWPTTLDFLVCEWCALLWSLHNTILWASQASLVYGDRQGLDDHKISYVKGVWFFWAALWEVGKRKADQVRPVVSAGARCN